MDELVEETLVQEEIKDEIEDLSQLNPIQNRYAFWYRYDSGKGSTNYTNYNQSIKKIASFQSVERFWNIYDYMKRPADYKDIKAVEYHLFKDGISPFWEDSQNKIGGKWMLRLRKGIAAKYWEDILLAIVGEQFDVGAEICGAVLSVRGNEDIISVWNKTAENTEAVNKIRDQIRRIVHLPDIIPLEYKVHADSLIDKSSYRNPNMVFRASTRPGGDRYGGAGGSGGGGYRHYQGGEQQQQQGGGYQHRNNDRSGWKQNNRNNWNGGNGNASAGGNNNGNGGAAQDKGAEDQEAQPSQRRERTEGHNPRDRGDGHENSGWRRSRSDGDHNADNRDRHNGDNNRPHNNRDRGDYQQRNSTNSNAHTNNSNAPASGSGGNAPSVSKTVAPSSVYSAGSGSFASRVKGASDASNPPAAAGESTKSPTGENWTKVNHLLPKGP